MSFVHVRSSVPRTIRSAQHKAMLAVFAVLFAFLLLPLANATVPTINVKTYGATGNGSTDDTFAINRAISAIPSGGAVLSFPCGTYVISSSLSIIGKSNVSVLGQTSSTGANCSTLKVVGSQSVIVLHVAGIGLSSNAYFASDAAANTKTITLTSGAVRALGITVGSYVLVSDRGVASNGAGSPLIEDQEVGKVYSISGDTITLCSNLSTAYTVTGGSYVQKILSPVIGDTVAYLKIDASSNTGSGSMGVELAYAASSVIKNVSVKNFLGTGASGGYTLDTGYYNSFHDSTCNQCGNGGSGGNNSVMLRRQTLPTVNNVAIVNTSKQAVFSFAMHQSHYGTISNVTVEAGGANGRPFKLLRASRNTFTNVTANHGGGGHNGFTISDISTYNTFTNCTASSNDGKGIAMFGNYNTHNTFTNCTAKYNTQAQFAQSPDYAGHYNDHYTTISGGTYCCQRGTNSALVSLESNNTSAIGLSIYDDNGVAMNGMTTNGTLIIKNNVFKGLLPGHDIYVFGGLSTSTYSGNIVPNGTTPVSIQ
jgi:parallel beta-helix repeat protein